MALPRPLPLPPVSDERLVAMAATAHSLRAGAADLAAAEAMCQALPELLDELTAWRAFAAETRRVARAVRAAGPNVVALQRPDAGPDLPNLCA